MQTPSKTLFLILFVLIVSISCTNQQNNGVINKANEIRSQYVTWENNDVARIEIKKSVQQFLNGQIGKNFTLMSDTPMKVSDISDRGNCCSVTFDYTDNRNHVGIAATLWNVPKNVALSLRIGDRAYITGILNRYTEIAGNISSDNILTFGWLNMNYGTITLIE